MSHEREGGMKNKEGYVWNGEREGKKVKEKEILRVQRENRRSRKAIGKLRRRQNFLMG